MPGRDHVAFTALRGWRIIAEPSALDRAPWPQGAQVVRISPDDVLLIDGAAPGQDGADPVVPDDPHAIVTPEHGFAGATLTADSFAAVALHHIEWPLPDGARPCVAQGQIAGVPAKLVLHADGTAQLLVACAARHELEERLNGVQR